jgi:hypothetical protein
MEAGIPNEVTFAPRVADVEVIDVDVGVVTVGITLHTDVVNVTSEP